MNLPTGWVAFCGQNEEHSISGRDLKRSQSNLIHDSTEPQKRPRDLLRGPGDGRLAVGTHIFTVTCMKCPSTWKGVRNLSHLPSLLLFTGLSPDKSLH